MLQRLGHAIGRLRHPLAIRHPDHRAEVAGERAAERRVMGRDPITEVMLVKVAVHRQPLVRPRRQLVEGRQRSRRRVPDGAVAAVRHAVDTREIAADYQRADHFNQGGFALSAHADVDGVFTQARRGVLRRKVAAPDDRHRREHPFELPATHRRGLELRAGHHGYRHRGNPVFFCNRENRRHRIGFDVAVDDAVVEFAFEQRADGEQRHRQRLLRRRRAPRVEEDDHRCRQCSVTAMPTRPISADEAALAARA